MDNLDKVEGENLKGDSMLDKGSAVRSQLWGD